MDHRRAVTRDHHRARGGIQMKIALVLAVLVGAAHADPAPPSGPPSLTPPDEPAPHGPPIVRIPPAANARTEAWVATGITAAIVGVGVYSVYRMHEASMRANAIVVANGTGGTLDDYHAATQENDRWHTMTYTFGALMVLSAGVTAYMWTRTETRYTVAVTPHGATVGYAVSF